MDNPNADTSVINPHWFPLRIQIHGFNDPKFKKIDTSLHPPQKYSALPSLLHFLRSFLPSWIWIRIPNTDPADQNA
jgi:hypothetical protein